MRKTSSMLLLVLVAALGCTKSVELPSAQTVQEKPAFTWRLAPQSELNSEQTLQKSKIDQNGNVCEIHIEFKDGSKAVQYLDVPSKRVNAVEAVLQSGLTVSAKLNTEGKLIQLASKSQDSGDLLFQLETTGPDSQKMSFYKSGAKVAEASGPSLMGAVPDYWAKTCSKEKDIDRLDCQPTQSPNTWIFFAEDGLSQKAKIEITRYSFKHNYFVPEDEIVWPVYQKDLCTTKQVFSADGQLVYEERAKIERTKLGQMACYDCFLYADNNNPLFKAMITRDPFDEHEPRIGTIWRFDELGPDGMTVKASKTFNIINGWLCGRGKDLPIDDGFKTVLFDSEEHMLSITNFQKSYSESLDFVEPLFQIKQ